MEILHHLYTGFSVILTPTNLLYLITGLIGGTIVGILPGIGSSNTIALLLPLLYGMNPISGIVMLCAIYYSSTYAGAIIAILLRIPGETSAIMTTFDGYPLARKGRGAQAIMIAAVSSFVGATLSVVGLMLIAPPMTNFALRFGPPEYAALMLLALVLLAAIGSETFFKGLIAAVIGVMLGTVGADRVNGIYRFHFGELRLMDGIPFIPVAVGLFAIAEVLVNIEEGLKFKVGDEAHMAVGRLSFIREMFRGIKADIRACLGAMMRGSGIGFIVGVLPGAGATVAAFFAYAIEKKSSKTPEKFGTGIMQGVAAPESADSSSTGGAMIPMLTLGIPGSKSTAMMLFGLNLMGLQAGPLLLSNNPEFFWAVVSSMYLGNFLVLVLMMPLAATFFTGIINRMSYALLYPVILILCIIGSYSVNGNIFEVYIALVFGVVGYLMTKLGIPVGTVVIAMILGPIFEEMLLLSLSLSDGSLGIFFTRGISASFMAITALVIVVPLLKAKLRGKAFSKDHKMHDETK